jgi:hypothetical protein
LVLGLTKFHHFIGLAISVFRLGSDRSNPVGLIAGQHRPDHTGSLVCHGNGGHFAGLSGKNVCEPNKGSALQPGRKSPNAASETSAHRLDVLRVARFVIEINLRLYPTFFEWLAVCREGACSRAQLKHPSTHRPQRRRWAVRHFLHQFRQLCPTRGLGRGGSGVADPMRVKLRKVVVMPSSRGSFPSHPAPDPKS